ncbi:Ig-like domain-containing protein [Candidatus Albibeggiatoa sp. nov. NOAA]|uniref:Ig-like domain-containing protein n=1 Tax=Candidatus Albibeggiatoa sp. nov. NOAA TaxID=3162724 RepID=UPI003303B810|nr:Ig-like domain-containing protein [Thiotrichaceae bacterium]
MNLFYSWTGSRATYCSQNYDASRHYVAYPQLINYILLLFGWLMLSASPVMATNCVDYAVDTSRINYCGCHTDINYDEYEVFKKAWSIYDDPSDGSDRVSSPIGQCTDISDESCNASINNISDGNLIYIKNNAGTDHFYCLAVFGYPLRAAPYIPVELDNIAPDAPTIKLDASTDSGLSNSDKITNNTTPILNGTAEENTTIIIYDEQNSIVDTAIAIGGHWSISIPDNAALTDGKYSYTAKAIDAAGNVSDLSKPLIITIDTIPAAYSVDMLTTNDQTPQLTGSTDDWKAEIDVRVLTQPAQYLSNAVSNNVSGTWVLADNRLDSIDEGTYDIEVSGVDRAGNASTYLISNSLTLDLSAPETPSKPDMTNESDRGSSNSDNITTDPTPTFTGIAETGSTVELFYDVTHFIGRTTATDGKWQIVSRNIPQGNHDITAISIDASGNQSERSKLLSVIIKAPVVQNAFQQDYYQFRISSSQAHIRSVPSGIDCEYGEGHCRAMFYRGTKLKLELVDFRDANGLTTADYNIAWEGNPDCADQRIDMQNHINCVVRFYGKKQVSENISNAPEPDTLEPEPVAKVDTAELNAGTVETTPDVNTSEATLQPLNLLNFSGSALLNGGAEDVILGFILDGDGLNDVTLHAELLDQGVLPQMTLNEVLHDTTLGFYGNVLIQEQNTEGFMLNRALAAGAYTMQLSSSGIQGRGMTGISLQNNQLDLSNISVRGVLDRQLILNFIVEGQQSQHVTIRNHILQGQVETQMTVINLTTGQVLADTTSKTTTVEINSGAYAAVLNSLSHSGIGMIEVDLVQ